MIGKCTVITGNWTLQPVDGLTNRPWRAFQEYRVRVSILLKFCGRPLDNPPLNIANPYYTGSRQLFWCVCCSPRPPPSPRSLFFIYVFVYFSPTWVLVGLYFSAQTVVDGTSNVGEFVSVNTYMMNLFTPLYFLGTVYNIIIQVRPLLLLLWYCCRLSCFFSFFVCLLRCRAMFFVLFFFFCLFFFVCVRVCFFLFFIFIT